MIQSPNRISERATSPTESRSLIDLIKELRDETVTLLRQEVALAKSETTEKVSYFGRNAASLAAGGLIAFAGGIFLLLAATVGVYLGLVAAGMSNANAGWLAPLIVGGCLAVIGGVLIQKALHAFRSESFALERTKASVIADKEWIQEKVH